MSDRATVKRLIDEAAEHHLGPLGLHRKGRSRLWFDDRGWFLITVEFQPGSGIGTYLNVGATWLWYDRGQGIWAFDEGGRIYWRDDGAFATEVSLGETGWHQRAEFIRDHLFAKEMELLTDVAGRCVQQLRDRFPDPYATAHLLTTRPRRRNEDPFWHGYNLAASHALCGDLEAARDAFRRVGATVDDVDWRLEARRRATELSLIDSPTELHQRIIDIIQTTRRQLGLAPWAPAERP